MSIIFGSYIVNYSLRSKLFLLINSHDRICNEHNYEYDYQPNAFNVVIRNISVSLQSLDCFKRIHEVTNTAMK